MIAENRVWVVSMGMQPWYATCHIPRAFHAYLDTIYTAIKEEKIGGTILTACWIDEYEIDLTTLAMLKQYEKGGELLLSRIQENMQAQFRRWRYEFTDALEFAYMRKWAAFDEGTFYWIANDHYPKDQLPPAFNIMPVSE